MTLNILLHGKSEGFNSEFMQLIYNDLSDYELHIHGFDFDYINNNCEPSPLLQNELSQLQSVIQNSKKEGFLNFNIIGKSLGGLVALHKEIVCDECVNKVIVLGFPFTLGFPPNLSGVKEKPLAANTKLEDDYIRLFNSYSKCASKVTIIQGDSDLAGKQSDINELMKKISVKPKVIYVANASHSFKPVSETSTREDNMNRLLRELKNIIQKG